ncbi:hypothetical protein SDJN02_05690, partial [Cucurbita argyrosperma subsp. argyrosperma]
MDEKEKPRKASCIVENWMTLTSLKVENIALNYRKNVKYNRDAVTRKLTDAIEKKNAEAKRRSYLDKVGDPQPTSTVLIWLPMSKTGIPFQYKASNSLVSIAPETIIQAP